MKARAHVHLDDDALFALVDGDDDGNAGVRADVAACPACARRLHEFRATRAVLESLGERKQQPQRDLAQRALASLRLRQSAIGNINEVFATLRTLLAGFAGLFGGRAMRPPPPEHRDES